MEQDTVSKISLSYQTSRSQPGLHGNRFKVGGLPMLGPAPSGPAELECPYLAKAPEFPPMWLL